MFFPLFSHRDKHIGGKPLLKDRRGGVLYESQTPIDGTLADALNATGAQDEGAGHDQTCQPSDEKITELTSHTFIPC
jgi:hypothetical protein